MILCIYRVICLTDDFCLGRSPESAPLSAGYIRLLSNIEGGGASATNSASDTGAISR